MDRREIIVIGGGLGGLAAAALLARAGRRVRLLEGSARLGGRARSRVQDGFVLNQGAHALGRAGSAARVLRTLGVHVTGRRVAGGGMFVCNAGELGPMPTGPWSLLTSDVLDARGKWSFARLLLGASERKARAVAGKTVSEWLDAEGLDARTHAMIEMFVRLVSYVYAPQQLSASVVLRQLSALVRHGVIYVDGGWQTIVDGLERRARELGVTIEVGAHVAAIERTAAVEAVRLRDGRSLPTAAVIAAVEPDVLAALLPGDAAAQGWARSALPVRAACLDLGVRELAHPERVNVQSIDAPLYFSNHSHYAALAPSGHALLHVVRYLTPAEDGKDTESELRGFLERVQPGAYERALVRRFTPNFTVYNAVPGLGRAPCHHPQIAGLHLVGDWVEGGELLLDGVLRSAQLAAAAIAQQPAMASAPKARDAGRAA